MLNNKKYIVLLFYSLSVSLCAHVAENNVQHQALYHWLHDNVASVVREWAVSYSKEIDQNSMENSMEIDEVFKKLVGSKDANEKLIDKKQLFLEIAVSIFFFYQIRVIQERNAANNQFLHYLNIIRAANLVESPIFRNATSSRMKCAVGSSVLAA
jgi:hypothetical protein